MLHFFQPGYSFFGKFWRILNFKENCRSCFQYLTFAEFSETCFRARNFLANPLMKFSNKFLRESNTF